MEPTMVEDLIEMTGRVQFHLLRPDGSEARWEADNLVTTQGKTGIANRMLPAPTATSMSHMAVGTGAASPAITDVALVTEVSRVALANQTAVGAVVTYTATFLPGVGTGALVEAGLFNAAAAGAMQNRTTFAVINKAAGDTLNVTWTVTVG
jgi:hypothetical protein